MARLLLTSIFCGVTALYALHEMQHLYWRTLKISGSPPEGQHILPAENGQKRSAFVNHDTAFPSAGSITRMFHQKSATHSGETSGLKPEAGERKNQEVLYLPNGRALHFLSFGYRNVLSDILWFATINYFGKHYKTDRNYRWLKHMCSLVTELNPFARHAYLFCSNMLSWEAGDPEAAEKLLTDAIQHEPNYWRYRYLRGFIAMYFLKHKNRAQEDFMSGAKLYGAPPFLARLAASNLEDPDAAKTFLESLLEATQDSFQRKAILDKLHSLMNNKGEKQ